MTERVVRAANLMSHRGPDDWGAYTDEGAALGFRRLAIIDLSPAGHQPMVSPDGNTVLVFNGEIYNYLELRKELEPNFPFFSKSDSEALLNGYQAWGWEELLQRIDGMFAIAIADLDARGAKIVISQHPRRAKPLAIDAEIYKWRHLIENFFCKLKEFKRIAMRADKTDTSFEAMINLAAGVINSR